MMKSSQSLLLFIFSLFFGTVWSVCSHEEEVTEKFDTLPAAVNAPTIPPEGYLVEDFGSGTYIVTEGSYQALFLVSTEGVILIDAPPTIGHKIGYAIGNITDKPITHVIYSHSHSDHIGSASLFTGGNRHGPKVEIIAHEDTALNINQAPDPQRPLPTKTFKQYEIIHIGNQTLELSYKGENHVRGNIFIYIQAPKVLMLVDVIFPGWAPFSGLAESTNIPGWIQAHDQVLSYDFDHYVGGHLGRSGTREDVLRQQEYVRDLFNTCNATIALTGTDNPLIGAGLVLGTVSKNNPGNSWAQFKVYLDVAAEYCANKTNEKWDSILGGTDVFGFENAMAMLEHLRLDYNILGPFGTS
ncbi:Metallo-hydrolase/oxidoreductase [Rhizodiscina lignyota]|uniref:Metallo-hydrolase/oxidoreductase n=1 Tax=Rhizodiscina lignyota TaxID=1504668 RepID=A0A9P4IHW9_9PEZI|nr:Metallo-hydrolase/oxidoreductase [Rhizodiscina lignyota]